MDSYIDNLINKTKKTCMIIIINSTVNNFKSDFKVIFDKRNITYDELTKLETEHPGVAEAILVGIKTRMKQSSTK